MSFDRLAPKSCGHPPNPEDDSDQAGRLYESCFQCFCNDLDAVEKFMHPKEPEPAEFEAPMAPGPHPLKGPILFFGGIILALFAVVFLLSCATPGQTSKDSLRRAIGDGLVFCLSHEPARSNPGFRDQCHVNAMFECLEHDLPRQCAEDTALTALPGGR